MLVDLGGRVRLSLPSTQLNDLLRFSNFKEPLSTWATDGWLALLPLAHVPRYRDRWRPILARDLPVPVVHPAVIACRPPSGQCPRKSSDSLSSSEALASWRVAFLCAMVVVWGCSEEGLGFWKENKSWVWITVLNISRYTGISTEILVFYLK